MSSFAMVIRSAYFGAQKRRKHAKSVGVNRSDKGMLFFISSTNGTNKNYRYLSVLRLILSAPIRLTKGKTEQKQLIQE